MTKKNKGAQPEGAGQSPDRKTVRKARRFVKDVEALLQKNRKKVSEEKVGKVDEALRAVRDAVEGHADGKQLSTALKELDARVDRILGFARKSTIREYAESITVAVLIAFLLRAFVVEAFKIPTGSMIPTLEVGDHIFVNKFIYGLRIPLTNWWLAQWSTPERGDVIVFKYPQDPSKDYIKRVVAVAGDTVRVEGRDVFVNGERLERASPQPYTYIREGEDERTSEFGPDIVRAAQAFPEKSQGTQSEYTVIYEAPEHRREWPDRDSLSGLRCVPSHPLRDGYCKVEDRYVFVMGDNRDNSSDSRSWGGVPLDSVKGKALFVWLSNGPKSGLRWSRFGTAVR